MKARDRSDRQWKKPASQSPNYWAERGGAIERTTWRVSTFMRQRRTIGIYQRTILKIVAEEDSDFCIVNFLKEFNFKPINHYFHDDWLVLLINFSTEIEAIRFKLTFPYDSLSYSDFENMK